MVLGQALVLAEALVRYLVARKLERPIVLVRQEHFAAVVPS